MADTTLPAVTAEVTPPTLLMADGQPTATSLQVAEHFGKRHTHVLRAIRNLAAELPDEHKPIFGLMSQSVGVGQGGLRSEPVYQMNRDGFALLAMGFTGRDALGWKLAYIAAFNAMEARLKSLYVEPLVEGKQFRNGIPLHMKFKLQEQSFQIMGRLMTERQAAARRNLYWQLRQVNDALGIPTESAEQMLGTDAPALPVQEGGAA